MPRHVRSKADARPECECPPVEKAKLGPISSCIRHQVTSCRHYAASQFPLGPSVNFSLGRSSPELVLAADEIHASVHALLLRDHADAVRLNFTLTSQLASFVDKSTVPSRFLRPHEQGFPTP